MSDYFNKLKLEHPDVAKRYQDKLSIINGVDPFALDAAKFSSNPYQFPPISNMDIVTYLVLTTSFYTKEQMKAFKSLNSFKYFEAGFVQKCSTLKCGEHFILMGKVKHSQRMNLPPLSLWIICAEDGSIETAHCTCMAGLGEVCSHVGALLFAVEHIIETRENKSCTDVSALWKVPTVSKVDFVMVKEMKFGQVYKHSFKKNIKPLTTDQISNMMSDIEEAGSSSVLMRTLEPWCSKIENDLKLSRKKQENPYTSLYKEKYEYMNVTDLISLGKQLSIKITEEECDNILSETTAQALSKNWFYQRTGRITASIFKKAVKTKIEKPSLTLIKAICYPQNHRFSNKATNWGQLHEKDALAEYEAENKKYHDLEIRKAGLIVDPQYPCFGASPDAMVRCSCCGVGCVEVKCPFSLKDISLEQYCKLKSSCLLIKPNEKGEYEIFLDENHTYYYQVQQQMALTKSNYCDFVIWSPSDLFIQRISFKEDFWKRNSEKSLRFHQEVIMPELLGKAFTRNQFVTYCICKSIDDGSPMICCENESCEIQWYHTRCVNLTEIPENEWLCPSCQGNN